MNKHLNFMLDQAYFSEFLDGKNIYLNTFAKYNISQEYSSLDETCSFSSSEKLRKPKNFVSTLTPEWKGVSIFIDDYITYIKQKEYRGAYNVLVLIESKEIKQKHYQHLQDNSHLCDLILTHDLELLNAYPEKSAYIPADTITLDESAFGLNSEKKKYILSHIYSSKAQTYGHKLRHQAAEMINREFPGQCDFFGGGASRYIRYKHHALQSYLFSIAIENATYEHYYTEKLMDCFISGTIPIYSGTSSASLIFDERGIIYFDDLDTLSCILNEILKDPVKNYKSRMKYIYANYLIAKQFLSLDDSIVYSLCGHLSRTNRFEELYPLMRSKNNGNSLMKWK